jgi:hypothetical protein
MLGAYVGENASEPLKMSNELSPLHLYLELLDDDLGLGKLRQIRRFSDHFDGINQILARLFQRRALLSVQPSSVFVIRARVTAHPYGNFHVSRIPQNIEM